MSTRTKQKTWGWLPYAIGGIALGALGRIIVDLWHMTLARWYP